MTTAALLLILGTTCFLGARIFWNEAEMRSCFYASAAGVLATGLGLGLCLAEIAI